MSEGFTRGASYTITYRDGIGGEQTARLEYVGQGWWESVGASADERLIIEMFVGPDGHVPIPERLIISVTPSG